MSGVVSPLARGRILQQVVPNAPRQYDQVYINQLVAAVNNYMNQAAAPGDVIGARYIMNDFPLVDPTNPHAYPDTSKFPTGMLYLLPIAMAPLNGYYLTVLLPPSIVPAAFPHTGYIRLNPDPPLSERGK
jgi:hypothetical protein